MRLQFDNVVLFKSYKCRTDIVTDMLYDWTRLTFDLNTQCYYVLMCRIVLSLLTDAIYSKLRFVWLDYISLTKMV